MNLAFVLFKYFPYGGLQRDCLKIARECCIRGHRVDVYCLEWSGSKPEGLNIEVISVKSLFNHKKYEIFTEEVLKRVKNNNYDAVVGFNKMSGLDFYFAADPCFLAKAKERSAIYNFLPRTRSFLETEKKVFSAHSKTHIFYLTHEQREQFINCYDISESRFSLLPPAVDNDRVAPADYDQQREEFRKELDLTADNKLILLVGSGFARKGVDRAISAMAYLPEAVRKKAVLMILGNGNPSPYLRLARKLNIDKQVLFLEGRDDAQRFMFAADALIHPAYREAAGMVIVEAIAARLPVLVTDNCGYSVHVRKSGAGHVHKSPFCAERCSRELLDILTTSNDQMRQAANDYYFKADLSGMARRAADIIEGSL